MRFILVSLIALFLTACGDSGGNNGGGSNPTPTPNPPQVFNCQNPLGGVLAHGASVTLFKDAAVPYGQSCQSEVRSCNNGVVSGSFTHANCQVLPEQEPATHEKPVKISDEGLKMGGIKELGDTYIVQGTSRMFSPPPPVRPTCATQPVLGASCVKGTPVCMLGQTDYSCEVKKTWKIFGWIYEKNGLDYSKMAEGVKVDIFWFAGCIAGMCESMAGPVLTDKWGYFEFTTSWMLDTLRLDGLPKYAAFCKDGKPLAGGGQYINADMAGKAIGPFKQNLVTPDLCPSNKAVAKSVGQPLNIGIFDLIEEAFVQDMKNLNDLFKKNPNK